MLTWPHDRSDWAPNLTQAEQTFAAIASAVSRFERLLIVCRDEAHRISVAGQLAAAGVPVESSLLYLAQSNDTWARDHGPITVVCGEERRLLDFRFNGWGGKYPAGLDDAITCALAAQNAFGATPRQSVDMVLEGGAIEVDGSGTLLTTERCLLAPTRNPGMSRHDIERQLSDLLGLNRVLWLKHGYLAGDDTDSHIDTLARFCDRDTIAYVACDDPADEHFTELAAMESELRALRTPAGAPYRLVPLPMPRAQYDEDGGRMPATYANFLIINGAVLVPVYNDSADDIALRRLEPCFPGREIIGINCQPLIHQHGSLHCVTMQIPAGVLSR
jgi:agmatine/peptidylarginine deiminase